MTQANPGQVSADEVLQYDIAFSFVNADEA